MTNIKQAYTPRKIVDSGLFFSIPLYQRLFEWGEDQIIQLLDDLYSSYKRDKESAYYIGMLTVKRTESSIELVDGQQRFTAMILLFTPIILAAMPTQISLFSLNVSIKSVTTCLSAFVAGCAFLAKICFPFTIFFTIICLHLILLIY